MDGIAQWLAGLGLERYAATFAEAEIDFDVLPDLRDDDLEKLGIPLGSRKRLLKAIVSLSGSPPPAPAALDRVAMGDGARRQLTVVFIDMMGSTALSQRLDPEDLQRVIRAYHDAVGASVARYDGHVAKFLGDGVLVYFGYPLAHEDDATRAVLAGLALIEAVGGLRPLDDLRLNVRVGIATGLVVVGAMGAGSAAAEQAVIGETPNLAARLQDAAPTNGIVVSDATRRLLGRAFDLAPLGPLSLKGLAEPVPAWRVDGTRSIASRFDAEREGTGGFVGRDGEVRLLRERWSMAAEGNGQAVLLIGEAGIGKSRIGRLVRDAAEAEGASTILYQCSPHHTNSPLQPVGGALERNAGILPSDPAELRIAKLAQSLTPLDIAAETLEFGLLLRLIGVPDGGRVPADLDAQPARSRTIQLLFDIFRRRAAERPVLFLVEDAHWIDASTEELIGLAIAEIERQRILMLLTTRPDPIPALGDHPHLAHLTLGRLSRHQALAVVESIAGERPLEPRVVEEILARTDGVPLFVEELTKSVLESGFSQSATIPATLHDSLMARLDRLAAAKDVAQVGGAIGRDFPYRLLHAVLDMPEAQFERHLAELTKADLVSRTGTAPDATFSFKHALIRDAAYNSMLISQRRFWHARIAETIERIDPAIATTQPEQLAYHYREAGNAPAAIRYGIAAGDRALARIAYREALANYEAALALLGKIEPSAEADTWTYHLNMQWTQCVGALSGVAAPGLRAHYEAARVAATRLNLPDKAAIAAFQQDEALHAEGRIKDYLAGLYKWTDADLAKLSPGLRAAYRFGIAYAINQLGDYTGAEPLYEEAVRMFEASDGTPGLTTAGLEFEITLYAWLAGFTAWRGYPERGSRYRQRSIELCRSDRFGFSARVYGQVQELQEYAARGDIMRVMQSSGVFTTIERSEWGGLLWLAYGAAGVGFLLRGDPDRAFDYMRRGYEFLVAKHGKYQNVQLLTGFISTALTVGRRDEAAEFLAIAEQAQRDGESRSHEAELLRFRARLNELDGRIELATQGYTDAIDIAERQGAKLFSLRAATDLSRMLQQQGGTGEETVRRLRPIYDWFTEGFDYPDLKRAKETLDRVSPPTSP